jgi:hypothetical protein
VRKASPHAESLYEAAEDFAENFGLSHEAEGESSFEDGVEVVDKIVRVHGVAVVTSPGSTHGLFETFGVPDERAESLRALMALARELVKMLADALKADGGTPSKPPAVPFRDPRDERPNLESQRNYESLPPAPAIAWID